jgi:hypothetical protein
MRFAREISMMLIQDVDQVERAVFEQISIMADNEGDNIITTLPNQLAILTGSKDFNVDIIHSGRRPLGNIIIRWTTALLVSLSGAPIRSGEYPPESP